MRKKAPAARRLNLGCGLNAPYGWVNMDYSFSLVLRQAPSLRWFLKQLGLLSAEHTQPWPSNVRRHNVLKGLPFANSSLEVVYSSHMLEHLYLHDALFVLREARRALVPGGLLRLALPDGDQWARDLSDGVKGRYEVPGLLYHVRLNSFPEGRPGLKRRLASLVGGTPHRWQPTRDLIKWLLREAGFAAVTELPYQAGDCPDLDRVEHRKESLYFEAFSPIE